MSNYIRYLIILVTLFAGMNFKTKEEWKTRIIYQLLTDRFARTNGSRDGCDIHTYCGGSFIGIKNNLDYITGMGFNAIWISPVVENTPGSYHGYHMTNLYKINPNFGTEQDFIDLVTACHQKDVWVMVDVVANHSGPVGTDYSRVIPFNSPDHYHTICQITDEDFKYHQDRVENCRLADLPDLKQENDWVRQKLLDWIKDLVQKYKIDGLRIDTIPEVPKWFWAQFAQASGVYQVGEVFDGRTDYVADYQNYIDALLNYPMYFAIKDGFAYGKSLTAIEGNFFYNRQKFKDVSVLGMFVDNHDNNRFLNINGDVKRFKNALAMSLLFEGIPIMYYGNEQYFHGGRDPENREPMFSSLNKEYIKILIIVRIYINLWRRSTI